MKRSFLSRSCLLIIGCAISGSALAQDGPPPTAGRPGRDDTPTTPNTPTETSSTSGRPGRAIVTDVGTMTDDDFLRETAGELGLPKRFDTELLNWFGLRRDLAARGYSFECSLTADYTKNVMGGISTRGDALRRLLDLRANFDLRAIAGITGGTFSVDFQNQSGQDPADEIGDAQGVGNVDADGRTQVEEVWYEQVFPGNKVRLKVGKIDANSEFAAPDYAGEFLNSSYGISPNIIGMPAYPDAALGANLFIYPTAGFYVGFGFYDGSGEDGVNTGENSPATFWEGPCHYFYVLEAGQRWALGDNKTLAGHAALGAWYHSGEFDEFNGGAHSGTEGFYAILEQKIIHQKLYDREDERGVYLFAQYAWADRSISDIEHHLGAGIVWTGPYEKRLPDTVGLGVSTVFFSSEADLVDDYESNVELFYNVQITPYFSVKPDIQYIVHPGGDGKDDALALNLRATFAF